MPPHMTNKSGINTKCHYKNVKFDIYYEKKDKVDPKTLREKNEDFFCLQRFTIFLSTIKFAKFQKFFSRFNIKQKINQNTNFPFGYVGMR